MDQLAPCPKCNSEHTYEDGLFLVCPECAHEWSRDTEAQDVSIGAAVIKDANGNVLQDGDSVTVIKDLTLARALLAQTYEWCG